MSVRYALAAEANLLAISYEAVADAPTIVNLTSHAYWNLAGFGTVYDHELQLRAQHGDQRGLAAREQASHVKAVLGQQRVQGVAGHRARDAARNLEIGRALVSRWPPPG